MSSAESPPPHIQRRAPENYTGPEKYWRAAEDWFELTLSPEQREICEHVAENQYSHIEGGNGFGKTYAIVNLALAFSRRHYPSSVVVTSGTYGKLKRTFCADAEALHGKSPFSRPSPWWPESTWKWSPTPHIDFAGEPTWQFEVVSPKDPGELEGVHNDYVLVIVDEADKDDVDLATLDSLDSLVSDRNDRMVVISNPPDDETNAVANMDEVGIDAAKLQFSTFDSHNVQVERGARDGERIGGLTGLHKLKKKWTAHNGEPWPGYDEARAMSTRGDAAFRTDLNTLWYKRFAGIIPPATAAAYRPFYLEDARAALDHNQRPADPGPSALVGVGIDVARKGGDKTIYRRLYPDFTDSVEWDDSDHNDNEARIRDLLDAEPAAAPIAIDAVGEGSGLADRLADAYPGVHRFKNGSKPATDAGQQDYYDKWTEALAALGDRLAEVAIDQRGDTRIREELFTAARVVEFSENRRRSGDVLKASPKSDITERLGHSPDSLDALVMAAWVADGLGEVNSGPTAGTFGTPATRHGGRR